MRALYAFCRRSDDIIDCSASSQAETQARLSAWRQTALSAQPPADDPVALAWADTRVRYQIPVRYAEQLLDGVGRDLCQQCYRTFEELAAYAYGVASTVGLMSMHIIGFAGEQALSYAVELGVALQLTNILRDVAEDWNSGRLYLPLDELVAFGLTEADLEKRRVYQVISFKKPGVVFSPDIAPGLDSRAALLVCSWSIFKPRVLVWRL